MKPDLGPWTITKRFCALRRYTAAVIGLFFVALIVLQLQIAMVIIGADKANRIIMTAMWNTVTKPWLADHWDVFTPDPEKKFDL